MKTINDFIKELESISPEKRELPLVVSVPNGELTYPSIKMYWSDATRMFGTQPDKMIITWE